MKDELKRKKIINGKLDKDSLYPDNMKKISNLCIDEINKKKSILPKNESIEVRIKTAIKALNQGRDPEEICRMLDWKEFEFLSLEAFKLSGYQAIKGFIFNSSGRRFQIDIISIRSNIILCVDCKHWAFSNWFSKLKEASENQLKRAEALSKNIELITKKFSIKISNKNYIIPVILTLGDPRTRIVEGVPIVSVLKLNDFLYGLTYPDNLGLKYFISTLPAEIN